MIKLVLKNGKTKRINKKEYNNLKKGSYTEVTFFNNYKERHRLDGPAVEWEDGTKMWFIHDKMSRLDGGPAVEWASGSKEWLVDGKYHRLDGPAIIRSDGTKAYYVDGKLHRLDGPAIERNDGHNAWYVDDIQYSENDYPQAVAEYKKNKREWWVNGTYHCEDRPDAKQCFAQCKAQCNTTPQQVSSPKENLYKFITGKISDGYEVFLKKGGETIQVYIP